MYLAAVVAESSTATVEITVTDVNDVVPALDRTEYSVAIVENTSPGDIIADVRYLTVKMQHTTCMYLCFIRVICQVDAMDGDAGENGQVLFSFVESGQTDFVIDELTGEITALTSFDYEKNQVYVLTIQVRDNATSSPLSSTARFVANITDANDNAPTFDTFPTDRTFSESTRVGMEIAAVSATDVDSGDNAAVSIVRSLSKAFQLVTHFF